VRGSNDKAGWPRLGVALAALLGLSMTAFSCDSLFKSEEKCNEAKDGVRASLKADDRALVQKWREYAYSNCADKDELSKLDQDITQAQADADKAKAEKNKRQTETKQLVDLFAGWAGSNKAAPQNAAANVSCDPGEAQEKSQERWCARTRQAGPHAFEVRYWEKEPAAARFSTKVPNPITCNDIGPHRVIRSWVVQGAIKRHHCEITGGAAAGLQALVTEAQDAPLHLFSARFVELDPALQAKLANEGR
jgi:hypothetical protein